MKEHVGYIHFFSTVFTVLFICICSKTHAQDTNFVFCSALDTSDVGYSFVLTQEQQNNTGVRVFPVVVHVVYSNEEENVSDAQILSQINVLNEDFRKMIGTPSESQHQLAVDTRIEFRLADTDPNGDPTNGITRTETTHGLFHDSEVKYASSGGIDSWDPTKYLNIWVCNYAQGGNGQFPTSSRSADAGPLESYGVIVNYTNFGDNVGTSIHPYWKYGNIATHEVGHYLGLFHPFHPQVIDNGNSCHNEECNINNDLCCDTPPTTSKTIACTNLITCGSSTPQLENFMDYTCDEVRDMFTNDQRLRMLSFIINDDVLKTVPNSLGFQNVSKDFIVFGFHSTEGLGNNQIYYDYNCTAPIVSIASEPYSDLTLGQDAVVNMRSKKAVQLVGANNGGFHTAEYSDFHAWIDTDLPAAPKLAGNYYSTSIELPKVEFLSLSPNPTTNFAKIEFFLPQEAEVTVSIYDLLGRRVLLLLNSEVYQPGNNFFAFSTSELHEGEYYCRLQVGNYVSSRKLIVTR